MATHSSTFAWRIPWPEESGGLHSMGSDQKSDLHFHFFLIISSVSLVVLPGEMFCNKRVKICKKCHMNSSKRIFTQT